VSNTKKLGYGRVSTIKQDLEIQIQKLLDNGVKEEDIFIEKQSGSIRNRVQLKNLMSHVREGDLVYVTKIDRLARSIIDLNDIVNELYSRNVSITFIDDSMTFKAGEKKEPLQTLLFNTLASFAQFERDLIISRTSEGRERAIKNGKKMGRKGQPESNIKRALHLYEDRENNSMSVNDIAKVTGVPRSTIYYEYNKKNSKK
jgi:DNA invertase Pin-like site-specific DNA recombinase